MYEFVSYGGREEFIQEILTLLLLLKVALGPLLHQLLQIVCILLHPGQEVVQDVVTGLCVYPVDQAPHSLNVGSVLWVLSPALGYQPAQVEVFLHTRH